MSLELRVTKNIRAQCPLCHQRILTLKHVVANMGSGKYSFHYHITCFLDIYEESFGKIVREKFTDEANPELYRRYNKPQQKWKLVRKVHFSGTSFELKNDNHPSSHFVNVAAPEYTVSLDKIMQTSASLMNKEYRATITEQHLLPITLRLFNPDQIKIEHLGFRTIEIHSADARLAGEQPVVQHRAVYLVQGVLK